MIDFLDPEFLVLVNSLLLKCQGSGISMIPYEKLRTPFLQAKYWKQGRTAEEINMAINMLKKEKAPFLVQCLETAIPNAGNIITNALPGCSWHQWGEAVDCYWLYNGRRIWDITLQNEESINGYQLYATTALELGLDAGYFWKNMTDAPHVQYQCYNSPLALYSYKEIDKVMGNYYSTLI